MLHVFSKERSGLKWAVYNKNSNVWMRGSLSPLTVLNMCGHAWWLDFLGGENPVFYAQPAVLNHKIFILGYHSHRSTHRSCTMVYDTWTQSVIRRAPMMNPRRNFACCVISGRIYVAGGSMKRRRASRDAIVYIPESDLWKPIPKMPTRRSGCLGAAVDGIFYVIGGYNLGEKTSCFSSAVGPYLYMSSMDSYDPETNTWRETKEGLPLLARVIACTVMGSHIYVLCSDPFQLSFFKYDTVNASWSRVNLPFIPTFNPNFSCVTMGSYIYIKQVQGCIVDLIGRSRITGLVLIYDIEMQVWSRGLDFPLLGSGAIYVVVER